jgi:hypothetical protein
MDPRLRTAVDASRRWYDDVFALHRLGVRVENGLWSSVDGSLPWHSAAKKLDRGVETRRVLDAVSAYEQCTVADSFGDLRLDGHGFDILFEATWLHRDAVEPSTDRPPDGWSVVTTGDVLAEWNDAHDYAGVLLPAVLTHPAFRVLACRRDGRLVGGAVTRDGGDAVALSNTWGAGEVAESDDVLGMVALLHPGRAVTDYARGAELDAMLASGFAALGPQRVWSRGAGRTRRGPRHSPA